MSRTIGGTMKLFGFEKMLMNESIMGDGGGSGGSADTSTGGAGNSAPPSGETFTAPEWAKGINVDPEILKAPMFTSIKSMDDVVKGYYHAQKMVGSDKVVVPNKNSSADEWKAFYQKAGVPAKLEEYNANLPESFDDQEFKQKLISTAFENNLRPDQLEKISALMEEHNNKIIADYEAEQVADIQKTAQELKQEWGQGFEKQIARANRVVKHFGGEEMHKAILESDLRNNGQFLRLMAKIGEKMLNEDTFMPESVSSFGMTKEEAKSKLNAIMGDSNSPYYNKDHMQHKEFTEKVLKFHEILAER